MTFSDLPALNSDYSPLAAQNRPLLLDRLTAAFDQYYANNFPASRDISNDFRFYYFRQELQAFVDMYDATQNTAYLDTAKTLALKAIADATRNTKPLYHHATHRGNFPTFNRSDAPYVFPRHQTELWSGQLNDFQGAAGLMLVATALKDRDVSGWREIADFVEQNIIEKWLFYKPNMKPEHFQDQESVRYLLSVLDSARDKREHFACICLDLNDLGYNKYSYQQWGKFIVNIYLTERHSLDSPFPISHYREIVPKDWGLVRQDDGTLIWHWTLKKVFVVAQDTSHANRTVWLAAQTHERGLIPESTIHGMTATFKKNIWDPQKGGFFFNDTIDGTTRADDPGRRGNVWFGWHRLAAYDANLKNLFISLAYDLTHGGPNVTPKNAQNRTFPEAPLCFFAWAARLISTE